MLRASCRLTIRLHGISSTMFFIPVPERRVWRSCTGTPSSASELCTEVSGCWLLFIVLITQSARFNGVFLGRTDEQQQRSSSRERNRVTISISVAPPMPTFPSPHTIRRQQRSRLARAVKINIYEAIYDINHQSGGIKSKNKLKKHFQL